MEENSTQIDRTKKHRAGKIVLFIALALLIFRSGYFFGSEGFVFEPKTFQVINQKDQPGTVDYGLLWNAIDVLNEHYIDKPVNPQDVLYGAVRGAVSATGDPYTEFFTPEDLANFQTELKGSFDGIGAEIGKRNGSIVIIAPLDDSPAKKAGILAGDYIIKVNDESTEGWSIDETVKKIRGQKGTPVKLTIYREGRSETFDVEIVRAEIKIESVKLNYKEVDGRQVAVITLSRFGDDTKAAFAKAVNEIVSKKVDKLILDLRNDPGGYLDTAVDVASYWVPKDELIVTEKRSTEDKIEFKSLGYGKLSGVKTLVLINGGSASASEIVAGALRDNGLAQLVGEKSFGKGSVQELLELPGNSAIKVTVAKWITPGGKNLNKDGLEPDIKIEMTEDDYKNQKDPQMDKALEEIVK